MKDIRHATAYTESQIMDAVFDASRANETRSTYTQTKLGKIRVTVRFVTLHIYTEKTGAMYKAAVYDTNGYEIGSAIVDKFDI